MLPEDKRHGTYAGAQQHLRDDEPMCEPCRSAFRSYQRIHAKECQMGRRRTMPTAPVTAHLHRLIESGMTTQAIADRSGVGRATVQDLISRPRATVRVDNAQAILGVQPQGVRTGGVSSLGTIRRVRALSRLGWSMTAVADKAHECDPTLPITAGTLRQLLSDQPTTVRTRTAVAVELAYTELSMRLPAHNRQTSQVRNRAERKGWLPPLAWDDIDDPTETPVGWEYVPADRARAVRDMCERGDNLTHAARALNLTTRALDKWCRRHGLANEYRTLAEREGDWNDPGNYAHPSRNGDAA